MDLYRDADFEGTDYTVESREDSEDPRKICRNIPNSLVSLRFGENVSSLVFGKGAREEGPDNSFLEENCCRLYQNEDFGLEWVD